VPERLLINASQQSQGSSIGNLGRSFHAGVFKEVYDVNAIEYRDSMMGVYPVLKPVSQWFYRRRSARIIGGSPEIKDINKSINEVYDAYGTKSKIDPSMWKMEKQLVLAGKMPFGVTFVLGRTTPSSGSTRLSSVVS